MQVRHLRPIGAARRSSLEPDTGLLAGAGEHILTLTVCGSPESEVSLAERGFVTALLAWAHSHEADLNCLAPLLDTTTYITGAELTAMIGQLAHLLDIAGTAPGWSLFASSTDQPGTYAGALLPTAPPTVLLATPTAAVAVNLDGLRLQLRGLTVHGWHRHKRHVVLRTTGGDYPLRTTTITAALLDRLAHGHTNVILARRPVSDLAAPLLDGLHTSAALAAARRLPLLLGSRPAESIRDRVGKEAVTATGAPW